MDKTFDSNWIQYKLPMIEERFGGMEPEIYKMLDALLQGMKKAAPKDKFYKQDYDFFAGKKFMSKKANPVQAKIFLLTDGRCSSACLIFADYLLAMPNVIHVGAPTSAVFFDQSRQTKTGVTLYAHTKQCSGILTANVKIFSLLCVFVDFFI